MTMLYQQVHRSFWRRHPVVAGAGLVLTLWWLLNGWYGAVAVTAIIGLLIFGHLWVSDNTMLALYWTGVLGLLVWTVMLAAGDFTASRLHYGPQVADQKTEHLLLQREIEKFRRETQSPETDPPEEHP